MGAAAVKIGKLINYVGAGTVEFIVDDTSGKFSFLEMITGLDLVELQIQIARGVSLKDLGCETIRTHGHAIEVRLYAEDPLNHFYPSTGKIVRFRASRLPGARFDTGIESGSEISIYYYPLISKVIVHGVNRQEAIQQMIRVLQETLVMGVRTNKTFLLQILNHPMFQNGKFNTHFIDNHLPPSIRTPSPLLPPVMIGTMLWDWSVRNSNRKLLKHVPSGYRNVPYRYQFKDYASKVDPSKEFRVEYKNTGNPR